ncbi:MAG: hypothetical protein LC687_01485 [Actinobacteria bacterium]|nr:hypothetical protein [Actinomycetota bacterium]
MIELQALSRQYVYAAFDSLNFDISTADVHRIAFLTDPLVAPADGDWEEAIVVDDSHPWYIQSFGAGALALLVGPARGDAVTTLELAEGLYVMWTDVSTPTSDERVVSFHGTVEVVVGAE